MKNQKYRCKKISNYFINILMNFRSEFWSDFRSFYYKYWPVLMVICFFAAGIRLISYGDFTAAGTMFTASLFLFGIYCYQSDYSHKKSEFYLKKISKYFNNAITLIQDVNNNNIKWHQAIENLKACNNLKVNLTEKPHQEIYLLEYISTAYSLFDILRKIDSYEFFYGVPNYRDKNKAQLYEDSTPKTLDESHYKISVDMLKSLCIFMDNANKAGFDLRTNEWEKVFHGKYFNRNMSKTISLEQIDYRGFNSIQKYIFEVENINLNANRS